MARLHYWSWGGAIRRTLHTDADDPYRLTVETAVHLPDLEPNNRFLEEQQNGRHMKLLARVPMTVWEQAEHEGWDDDDWRRWLNDPDNKAFRVWKGRV